jgi:hypothetical protein
VLVPKGWARALLEAQRRGEDVVGGGVANAATDRTVDWAAFLCEYSHLLPPLPNGPSTWLTGNNTVYRRALLQQYGPEAAGAWEDRLHDVLRRHGVTLFFRPGIVVRHKKHYTVAEYLSQRYLYARAYAGARFSRASRLRRILGGLAALALPPVLFRRIVWRVFTAGQHRAELARSLPLLALFVGSWAVGEAVGAWAGSGRSLSRVC